MGAAVVFCIASTLYKKYVAQQNEQEQEAAAQVTAAEATKDAEVAGATATE